MSQFNVTFEMLQNKYEVAYENIFKGSAHVVQYLHNSLLRNNNAYITPFSGKAKRTSCVNKKKKIPFFKKMLQYPRPILITFRFKCRVAFRDFVKQINAVCDSKLYIPGGLRKLQRFGRLGKKNKTNKKDSILMSFQS